MGLKWKDFVKIAWGLGSTSKEEGDAWARRYFGMSSDELGRQMREGVPRHRAELRAPTQKELNENYIRRNGTIGASKPAVPRQGRYATLGADPKLDRTIEAGRRIMSKGNAAERIMAGIDRAAESVPAAVGTGAVSASVAPYASRLAKPPLRFIKNVGTAINKPAAFLNKGGVNLLKTMFPKISPYSHVLERWGAPVAAAGFMARMADAATGFTQTNDSDTPATKGAKGVARSVLPFAQLGNIGGTAIYSAANHLLDKGLSPYIRNKTSSMVSKQTVKSFMEDLSKTDPKSYLALMLATGGSFGTSVASKGKSHVESGMKLYDMLSRRYPDSFPEIDAKAYEEYYNRGMRKLQDSIATQLEKSNDAFARRVGKSVNAHPDYFNGLFNRVSKKDFSQPLVNPAPFFAASAVSDGIGDALKKHLGEHILESADMSDTDAKNISKGIGMLARNVLLPIGRSMADRSHSGRNGKEVVIKEQGGNQ